MVKQLEEHTELFVLFPEYIDRGQKLSAPYLNTINLLSEEEMDKYINNLQNLICFLTHENYIGYFDMENVRAFSRPLEEIEDCYPNKHRLLLTTINKWNNWRDEKVGESSIQYFYKLIPISSETLSEIAERKKQNASNEYIVINNDAIKYSQEILPVYNVEKENQNIKHKQCECRAMHGWFSNNRKPKRIYNYNPKHGENGVGNKKGESPLLCSRQEAATLLPNAVGTSADATLFYYDEKHGHYIEFKNENTAINSYHAFHIADKIVCHRVPKEVIKKIELIMQKVKE